MGTGGGIRRSRRGVIQLLIQNVFKEGLVPPVAVRSKTSGCIAPPFLGAGTNGVKNIFGVWRLLEDLDVSQQEKGEDLRGGTSLTRHCKASELGFPQPDQKTPSKQRLLEKQTWT